MTEYNFIKVYPPLDYLQYKKMGQVDQICYLNWCQFLLDRDTKRMEIERAGGVEALAKAAEENTINYLENKSFLTFNSIHIPEYCKSSKRVYNSKDMFEDSSTLKTL